MNKKNIRDILKQMDYIRVSGSAEEKEAADTLQRLCEGRGIRAFQESFEVDTAEIRTASLTADGREIPCTGYKLCGSGRVEGE